MNGDLVRNAFQLLLPNLLGMRWKAYGFGDIRITAGDFADLADVSEPAAAQAPGNRVSRCKLGRKLLRDEKRIGEMNILIEYE